GAVRMSLFHDEEDRPDEPSPGLPEALPDGETVVWQGRPSSTALAVHAFHVRFIAGYFVLVTAWRAASIASNGGDVQAITAAGATSALAAAASLGLVFLIAWAMVRSTLYTITTRRLVLRYGVAIRKYINLPFADITAVKLKKRGDGGDIAFETGDRGKIAYLHLWPHARPFRFRKPEPMLRALPDAASVAETLAATMTAASPSISRVDDRRLDGDAATRPQPSVRTPVEAAAAPA
ncbi:MAG: photosynthetic complex putative assembly protein PuhB, partial [Pseudomonadota bacterium]